MDSAHWPQVLVKTMEDQEEGRRPILERKAKPGKDQVLNCPRCNSTNTKFCYYNNYSLSQPRYFCKSCRRYWTAGGSLRNIPVGGASRKNKRSTLSSSISTPSTSSSAKKIDATDHVLHQNNPTSLTSINSSSSLLSDMDQMLKIGLSSRELIPFMPMPAPDSNSMSTAGANYNPLHEFKPTFDLSPDGFESGMEEPSAAGGARNLFTVEDHFKQVPIINSESDQNGGKLGDLAGFWNGIFGGGSW